MVRVVLSDNHPPMRFGLKSLLRSAGLEVVGEATGKGILPLVKQLRPDLVIFGPTLTGEDDEVEVCRHFKSMVNAPRVLVHSGHERAEDVTLFLSAGVDSYVSKRADCDQFLEVVRRTALGERVWLLNETADEPECSSQNPLEGQQLTVRESEVLVLLLRRYSNAEISEELYISRQTTKNYVSKLLKKTSVCNRIELLKRFQ